MTYQVLVANSPEIGHHRSAQTALPTANVWTVNCLFQMASTSTQTTQSMRRIPSYLLMPTPSARTVNYILALLKAFALVTQRTIYPWRAKKDTLADYAAFASKVSSFQVQCAPPVLVVRTLQAILLDTS